MHHPIDYQWGVTKDNKFLWPGIYSSRNGGYIDHNSRSVVDVHFSQRVPQKFM